MMRNPDNVFIQARPLMMGTLDDLLAEAAARASAGAEENAGRGEDAGAVQPPDAGESTGTGAAADAGENTGDGEAVDAGENTGAGEVTDAGENTGEGEVVHAGENTGAGEAADAGENIGAGENSGESGAATDSPETGETNVAQDVPETDAITGESVPAGSQMVPAGTGPLDFISFEETMAAESLEESVPEEAAEGSAEYVIDDNGETQVIFEAEPETEYIVSTPVSADKSQSQNSGSGGFYKSAAGAIAKTAQSAAKNAEPALKTIGFNLVNAVLIMFIGVQLAKLFRKMLNKAFDQFHMDNSLKSFLSSIIYALTCGVAAFMALERVGVSSASIVALLGSAGLAVSLSLQDFLGNFAGGVIILILKPFRTGDYIVCGEAEGTVSATSLFYTTLNTIDNRQMILPNGALSNANIINVTAEPRRKLEIRVQISYDSDIRKAKEILQRMFDEHPDILHEEPLQIFVDSLGDSGITLVGRGWIATEKYWPAKWAITENLKYAYDEAGIEIPFTQMVVHMRDSAKPDGGGTKGK